MDNIIITQPHEVVATLGELAAQINTKHGQVEASLHDALSHARQAGVLLCKRKAASDTETGHHGCGVISKAAHYRRKPTCGSPRTGRR